MLAITRSLDDWNGQEGRVHGNGRAQFVVAQAVNAIIAGRSHHFLSPSSSMWTQFIRSLMGRRVGGKFNIGGTKGGEDYEECLSGLQGGPAGTPSNVSHADLKRCAKAVPRLMGFHREARVAS